MADYPDTKRGFLMKGALIELKPAALIGVMPSIVIFQYNPAGLSRSITPANAPSETRSPPAAASDATGAAQGDDAPAGDEDIAVRPGDPRESFTLNLVIDAYDDLNQDNKLGLVTGIADRIAALEMLAYPNATLFEQALDAVGDAIGDALGVRRGEEPTKATVQLFYFGPGKIVPVVIKSMTVNEQQFHATTLYPIRAEVTVELDVLRESDLDAFDDGDDGIPVTIAKGCYIFTREQKSLLATIGGPIRLLDAALTAADPDLGDIL
ncbi:hypothetical protein [Chachezhania antarctica]|uniref:hypothetical protein n=1 Tax=Chachezhania antarctica TaxID=2340860 RepID=UPI000EB321D1|nr:hypothetical protein [Chachezhania antarctica]